MTTIPPDVSVKGRLCVVVGAGASAVAAVRELLCAGARVRLAGRLPAGLSAEAEHIAVVPGKYRSAVLKGAALVVPASSAAVNAAVTRDAKSLRVRVAKPSAPLCASPANAGSLSSTDRMVRDNTLIAALGDEYAHLGRIIALLRPRAVKLITSPRKRLSFFEALADDAFLEVIRRDGCQRALLAAEEMLKDVLSTRGASG
jgi:siroheme synthase (precorrin-2 oxidase/ferrochelatase)